jgi:hypothetical protein
MITRVFAILVLLSIPVRGEWLTESKFERALARPLIATRDIPAPLKPFLQRLAEERQVAVLLDRRIDPGSLVRVNLNAASYDAGIFDLADQVGAGISVVADTVIVSPPKNADRLRTLIWLRKVEIKEVAKAPVGREFELVHRIPVHWDDLTEPQQLIAETARTYGLTIEGLDLVPYDLWGAGDLAHPNAVEALSILLAEFDLSFEWVGTEATTIRLVPAPERVTLQKDYAVAKEHRDRILGELELELPLVQALMKGSKLEANATLEEHEQIAAILKGERTQKVEPVKPLLSTLRFSPKIERKPAGSLLVTLQAQGINVQFDPATLQEQGVDLRVPVTMNLQQATIQMLLDELARQVHGLRYRIEGETIFIEAAMPAT